MVLPKYFQVAILVSLCCLLFSAWVAPSLPAKIATHWGLDGKANGFSGSGSIIWLGAIPLFMLALFYAFPKVDPLWDKYGAKAREKYWFLTLVLVLFFFAVTLLTMLANLGCSFDMGVAMSALLGFLFICLGYYLVDCKPSWFVGIRTPWALSSEDNWRRTHEVGAKIFYALGAALVICAIILPSALVLGVFLIIVACLALFAYSYLLWRREGKPKASALAKGKKK